MIGQNVSHYKILEKLGEGGMGVVYRAEDQRLKRQVALKFLPPALLAGEDEKSRFVREAQSAAALSDSHIATVFSIEEWEHQTFIVLELIEGRPLSARIASGPLKISEAIDIALQVCEGLRTAHEKGIVHRDIKSANLMLTDKGQVKILDFGLAKLKGASRITRKGTMLGTVAYMSPEQLRGESLDERTDIWSLGVVLYEMIAGRLPFQGEYEEAMAYQITNEQPETLTAVRAGVPMALEGIVAKMLAKDPAARYQHVEEIPVDLRAVRSQTEKKPAVSVKMAVAPARSARRWIWTLGGVALGALATAAAVRMFGPADISSAGRQDPQRFSVVVSDSTPLAPIGSAPLGIGQPCVAISEDGSLIVYVVQSGKRTSLRLRPMIRYESTELQGTEGAYCPFFSPSGRWIAFFSGNQLKKISVGGGSATTLCEATNPRGGVWGADDRIYFCDKEGSRLNWVPSAGGTPTAIVVKDSFSFGANEYPSPLPDGKSVLCGSRGTLKTISLDDGTVKILGVRGASPRYIKTGRLIFYSDGSLNAVPFDPATRTTTGSPLPIVDGVLAEAPHFAAHYSVSSNGTLVYVAGTTDVDSRLIFAERGGTKTPLPFTPAQYGTFQISPDGRRLAVLYKVLGMDLWVFDLDKGLRTRMSTDGTSGYPIWSADGKWIIYSSGAGDSRAIVRELADGSGMRETIPQAGRGGVYGITPDGRYLAISSADSTTGNDVLVVPLIGSGPRVRVAGTPANEWGASFSRDGRFIAYVSDESGQYEIYVQPFPPDGRRWQISTEGGEEPVWSGTGRELFYRCGEEWVVVAVSTVPGFSMGTSAIALSGVYVNVSGRSYDVTSDGRRLLVLERLDVKRVFSEIRVVTNWFGEVDAKLRGR
jgi:Tol biopolymer transport system component/predicted Ser/Thr protein kinase